MKSKARAIMKSCVSTIGLGIAVFAFFGFQPAEAGCQLIHATHSARSQGEAVENSRTLALRSAYDLQRASGWSHITLSAHQVQGEPFWKAVRPNGVPAHARIQPDLVTAQLHDLFYRRSSPLCLHYGFERLRPITILRNVVFGHSR